MNMVRCICRAQAQTVAGVDAANRVFCFRLPAGLSIIPIETIGCGRLYLPVGVSKKAAHECGRNTIEDHQLSVHLG